MRADVIVVGLGTVGAAAAYQLATRGLRVLGLDRFAPPHERGAHGGGSRIIRTAYMEGADYVPLVRRSYQLWRDLEIASGEALLTPTGGLMLGPPDSLPVAGSLAAAKAHGLEHHVLNADEVRRRFPAFSPADDEVGLFEVDAGVLRPDLAVAAFLRLARAGGADLRTGIRVEDWSASESAGVSVNTSAGVFHADHLVLAPGAWAPELTRLRVQLRVERRVQHYWRGGGLFTPERLPVWIWDCGNGQTAYGLPSIEDAVKAAFHDGEELVDPDLAAEPARATEIAAMRAWLSTRLPGLSDWLGAKPCLYTLTPDGHFVVGLHPDHPEQVAVACGFSGHGFKFAPVMGEILADLVQHDRTDHGIRLFDPGRFTVAVRAMPVPVTGERSL